jgi:hypothetical protein
MGENWVRINDNAHQYGSNNYVITGDMREYGTVYYGANGRGIIMGFLSDTPNTSGGDDDVVSVKIGDIDLDKYAGKMSDIITLAKYFAGKISLSKEALANAQCTSGDTIVDSADLSALIGYLLNEFSSLPV